MQALGCSGLQIPAVVDLSSHPPRDKRQVLRTTEHIRLKGTARVVAPAVSRGSCVCYSRSPFREEEIGAEHGEGFSTFRSQGPLHVDVDFLNDRMRKKGLQRIRLAMRPDEAFGLIYCWENVLADTNSIKLRAWRKLAEAEGRPFPEGFRNTQKMCTLPPVQVIQQVLLWTRDPVRSMSLASHFFDIYNGMIVESHSPMHGLRAWLTTLYSLGVPCAVATSLDRITLMSSLQRMGLSKFFRAFVTAEDGMENLAHGFLSAAVKLDRSPSKCIVFVDDLKGITAAHNCSMKAVALIGTHPAYELKQADLTISSYSELSVINMRRLFANSGQQFMDLHKQTEGTTQKSTRRLRHDTWY